MYPHQAAPRHFSGQLLRKDLRCTLGLHRVELRLQDDDGGTHTVYIAHGRGAAAGSQALAQWGALAIGMHYHGSGSICRLAGPHTEWAGQVCLQPCRRRHSFASQARAAVAGAAAGAAA